MEPGWEGVTGAGWGRTGGGGGSGLVRRGDGGAHTATAHGTALAFGIIVPGGGGTASGCYTGCWLTPPPP